MRGNNTKMIKKHWLAMIVIMAVVFSCYAIDCGGFHAVSVKKISWVKEVSQKDANINVAFELMNSKKENLVATIDITLYRRGLKGMFHEVGHKQIEARLAAGETKAMKEKLPYLPTAAVDLVQVRVARVSKI